MHLCVFQNKENMLKVSIITAAYNVVDTLASTMQSVINQTYSNIEYIIVDGGSKDGTVDVIRKYEPQFGGRLRWVSEPDGGIYDAMNKGIMMATGDVVGMLNADDYFTSDDVVSRLVSAFADSDLDAVYGDIHFVSPNDLTKCVRYYSSKKFSSFWLRFGFMPAHPSFYLRKPVYEKAGLYKTDYKLGSDFEMMVRLFHIYRIHYKYIPMDFVTMRTGGASTKDIKSRWKLLKEDARACRENGIYTNPLIISLKYLYKITEFLKTK